MPRGSYIVYSLVCKKDSSEAIKEIKKKEGLSPEKMEKLLARAKKHKNHYNGVVRLPKNKNRKEYKRNKYCRELMMVTENECSSPVKPGTQS